MSKSPTISNKSTDFSLLAVTKNYDDYISTEGLGPKAAIALSAMAKSDNIITAEEYEALAISGDILSQQSENPLLLRVLILKTLLDDIPFSKAISDLKLSAKNQTIESRKAIIASVIPLLNCQALENRKKLITTWLNALSLKMDSCNLPLDDMPSTELSFMNMIKEITISSLGIENIMKQAQHIATIYKDEKLQRAIVKFEDKKNQGNIPELLTETEAAAHRALKKAEELLPSKRIMEEQEKQAERLFNVTCVLINQTRSRLQKVKERLQCEHEMYSEDFYQFIDSSLDNVEIGMRDLVAARRNWADETIWEQFSKREISQKIYAGHERFQNKYKKLMQLWERELQSFSNEMEKTSRAVLDNVEPMVFSGLVKTNHGTINLKNQIDLVSDLTIGLGIVGGVLIATGVIPVAIIGTFVAPIAGIAGGAALIWKLVSDPEKRKRQMIQDKRTQIREGLTKVLGNPVEKHNEFLNNTSKGFLDAATKYYSPLVRDAGLAVLQAKLQVKAVQFIKENVYTAFEEYTKKLQSSNETILDKMGKTITAQYERIKSIRKKK